MHNSLAQESRPTGKQNIQGSRVVIWLCHKFVLYSRQNNSLPATGTMHKEIYLIKGMQEEEYTAFLSRIAGIAEYVAERLNPVTIKYTVTAKAPPKVSIIPFSRHKI